jgi:SAM-dependent methyltransferase
MDTGPRTLEAIETMDNFNRWMYERFAPHIGRRVLEVGAGIGNLTQFYIDRELVVATDIEDGHLEALEQKFGHLNNVRRLKADFMDDLVPLLGGYRFDTAVSSNVLEHIKNDRKALENMFRVLIPGGHVVILVPAFMWLYGSLDEHLLHHRRYTRKELVEKVRTAGFDLVSVSWMNMFGMPGWFLNARIRRVTTLPAAQLHLFDKLVPVFRAVENITGPPVGQSLIVVGRKP